MNKKYLFVSYRSWANEIYNSLPIKVPRVENSVSLINYIKENKEVEYIFFVGWSNIIDEYIIKKFNCFCIHPSMLPLYRGGSPIQNQILDGIVESGLTLFKMDKNLDSGPIFSQKKLSLDGSLEIIFERIINISIELLSSMILKIENNELIKLIPQDEKKATFCKRRKPSQSEITLSEISTLSALQLHNKIRCLDDPYPNAYIVCSDGKKLFLKKSYLE